MRANANSDGFAGILTAMLSSACLGLSNVLSKMSFGYGNNPISLTVYRAAFAVIILAPLLRVTGQSFRVRKNRILPILLLGLLGQTLTSIFINCSYLYIPAGTSMTLHFLYPAIVCIVSATLFREKLPALRILVLIIAFGGVLFFFEGVSADGTVGIVLALLSGLSWAFYIIYMERSGLSRLSAMLLNLYMCVILALSTLAYGVATGDMVVHMSPQGWLITFVSSVLFTVGLIALQKGITLAGGTLASILGVFEPIVGIAAGALLLGEMLTTGALIGSGTILVAIALLIWTGRPKKSPALPKNY